MIVVDASVAVKWMISEPDTLDALRFLRTYGRELGGPDLIFVEVASAIVRRANANKTIGQEDTLRVLRKWTVAWAGHTVKTFRVTQRRLFVASSIALRLGHPLKDCIYLGLAREFGCELVTCDVRFRNKAVELYPNVRLLADYAA